MQRRTKILLAVAGVVVVLGGLCCCGGVAWMMSFSKDVAAAMESGFDDGLEAGARLPGSRACLDVAIGRGEECKGDFDTACVEEHKSFLEGCLVASADLDPAFCANVPTGGVVTEGKWPIGYCQSIGRDSPACYRVAAGIVRYCARAGLAQMAPEPSATPAKPGAAGVGAAELGGGDPSATESGATESGATESGATESGATESGATEDGAAPN